MKSGTFGKMELRPIVIALGLVPAEIMSKKLLPALLKPIALDDDIIFGMKSGLALSIINLYVFGASRWLQLKLKMLKIQDQAEPNKIK